MLLLPLTLAAICVAIAGAAYLALKNKDLKEQRDPIIITSALAIGAVCIFGIFAYQPAGRDKAQIAEQSVASTQQHDVQSAQVTAFKPEPAAVDTGASEPEAVQSQTIKTEATVQHTSSLIWATGDIFRDCDTCPELVVIPAGDNDIGEDENTPGTHPSEYPRAWVRIADNFAVSRYEIQVREFRAFAKATNFVPSAPCNTDGVGGKNASFARPGIDQGPEHPVVCVSAHDAQKYVDWLSRETGKTYGLLSEARWEYTRRSKTSARQAASNHDHDVRPQTGNIRDEDWVAATLDVGRFNANQFLVYDMLGNAAEWTSDCWTDNNMLRPKNANPVLDQGDCTARAVRGGSWDERAHASRPASRRRLEASARDWRVGFRVMRLLGKENHTRLKAQ